MYTMRVNQISVPAAVKLFFQHRHETGFDAGYAWVFSRSELVIFQASRSQPQILRQSLPYASGSAKHFVCILPDFTPGQLGVLLISDDGNAALWPDFGDPQLDPLTSRITGNVSALASNPNPGTSAILAVVGLTDGSLQKFVRNKGSAPAWRPMDVSMSILTSGNISSVGGTLQDHQAVMQAQSQAVLGLSFVATSSTAFLGLLVLRSFSVELIEFDQVMQQKVLCNALLAQELEVGLASMPLRLEALAQPPAGCALPATGPAAVVVTCPRGVYLVSLEQQSLGIVGTHLVSQSSMQTKWCASMSSDNTSCLVLAAEAQAAIVDTLTGLVAPIHSTQSRFLSSTFIGGGWLMLDTEGDMYNVQKNSAVPAPAPSKHQAGPFSTSKNTAVLTAVSTDAPSTDAVFQTLNAACQGQLSVAQMAQQLSREKALKVVGSANPVAKFSRHVLDTLPKVFGAGAETVGDQLQGKLAMHNVLLQCLSDGGSLVQLPPATLRSIFEDGQKLRALVELRDLESRMQDQRISSGFDGDAFPLHEVVKAAGGQCMGNILKEGNRTPWEVFYACPSLTSSAFFEVVGNVVHSLATSPQAAVQQLKTISQLTAAIQAALSGAYHQRLQYQQWFPQPANTSAAGVAQLEWTVSNEVKASLQALAEGCIRLYYLLQQEAPDKVDVCVSLSFDLTERLLNLFAASIPTGNSDSRTDEICEYHRMRDMLLRHLLLHSTKLCQAGGSSGDTLLQHVESLAIAHSGYAILYDVCDFTGDRSRLYHLMSTMTADHDQCSMTTYVFERLLHDRRWSELMDLPAEFDDDLEAWLALPSTEFRQKLRWIHDVRRGDYASSARNLCSILQHGVVTIAEAKRLLALNKLAVWASSPQWPSGVSKNLSSILSVIDKRCQMVKIQEKAYDDQEHPALMDCGELMKELCQQADVRHAVALIEVYSIASVEERNISKEAFAAAWEKLIAVSSWEEIAQCKEKVTDEEFWLLINKQPVYIAAQALFSGSHISHKFNVSVEEVNLIVESLLSKLPASAQSMALLAFQAGCQLALGPQIMGW